MNNKIWILLVALSLFSIAVYSQDKQVREVGSFHGIRSSQGIDVYLKKGPKESVRVEVSGIDQSDLITEVAGSNLRIHMREGVRRWGNHSAKVYVTYVALDRIHASSASNIFSEDVIKASTLEINCSSGANAEIRLECDRVVTDASSAGKIRLEGKATTLELEASSAGDIDAYNLESEIVHASASSAGSAKVNSSKEIEAQASSGGSIRYRGNPTRTNTSSSSGGSVKKSN
ncbi:MAG: DUF2807 domain-containing protein [Cyclobacteriaceae bacterium]|nr:DUF2807 domain-containing protein [Cyclobacteriaceae bacterium]